MNVEKATSRAKDNAERNGKPYVVFEYEDGSCGVTSQACWEDPSIMGESPEWWEGCTEIELIEPKPVPVPERELAEIIVDAISRGLINECDQDSLMINFVDGSKWLLGDTEDLRLCLISLIKGVSLIVEQWVNCEVISASEEYGTEYFEYSNLNEALAGFGRLKENSQKCTNEDKITRTLKLVIISEEINPED